MANSIKMITMCFLLMVMLQICNICEASYYEATVYNDCGRAADGTYVYEGMVAVDPSVIPLGTEMYIEFPPPYSYMSGVYRAHDTGGMVYGNVIDVWVPWSENELYEFGRRSIRVTFL